MPLAAKGGWRHAAREHAVGSYVPTAALLPGQHTVIHSGVVARRAPAQRITAPASESRAANSAPSSPARLARIHSGTRAQSPGSKDDADAEPGERDHSRGAGQPGNPARRAKRPAAGISLSPGRNCNPIRDLSWSGNPTLRKIWGVGD